MEEKLRGIFAPINTPFREDESVNFEGLEKNLGFYLESELAGLLLLGSNGEYKSLGEDEKIEILQMATSLLDGRKTVIVGLMYESLYLAKKFIDKIRDFKIDYLLVQPPFYFRGKLTEDDYFQYYTELANISPFPILIYNAPGFTGVDFSEQLINRLAGLDKVVGIKDSSKEKKQLDNGLSVLTGTVNTLYQMLEEGAIGGIVSMANFLPEIPISIYNEFITGNTGKAKELQELANRMNSSISGKSGVAGVKAAMDAAGLVGGNVRKPLKRLSPEEIARIRESVKAYNNNEG